MSSLADMARKQLEEDKKKEELKKQQEKQEKKIEELHPPRAPEPPKMPEQYEEPPEILPLDIDIKEVNLAEISRRIADSNIFQMLITNIVRMVVPEHKFTPGMNRKSKNEMNKDFMKGINEINKSVKITTDVKEIMRGSKLAYADVIKELKVELEKRKKIVEKGENDGKN